MNDLGRLRRPGRNRSEAGYGVEFDGGRGRARRGRGVTLALADQRLESFFFIGVEITLGIDENDVLAVEFSQRRMGRSQLVEKSPSLALSLSRSRRRRASEWAGAPRKENIGASGWPKPSCYVAPARCVDWGLGDPGGLTRRESAGDVSSRTCHTCHTLKSDENDGGRAQVEHSTGSEQREQSGTRDSLRRVGHAGQRSAGNVESTDSCDGRFEP